MDLAELLTVETSVLQALCMSTGSESTELRDTILRELEQDDFYFPITRTIYAAVSSMSRDNSPVDAESLLRALSRRSVDIPDDFFLEDLFTGAKPSKETLAGWLNGVKNGEEKEADAQTKPKTQPKVAPPTKPTLADTHRSVKVTSELQCPGTRRRRNPLTGKRRMARLPGRPDKTAGRTPRDRLFDLRPSLGRARPRLPLAGRRGPTARFGFSQAARRPDRDRVQAALPLFFVRAHKDRASALHAVAAVPRTVGAHPGWQVHQGLRSMAKHHPHRRTSRRLAPAHLRGGADAGSPGVTDSRHETDASRLWSGCVVSHRY